MTLETIITKLKKEFSTITVQINEQVYELSEEEYNAKIEEWANFQLQKQIELSEIESKAAEKAALLNRLGITEAEAQLLLSQHNL